MFMDADNINTCIQSLLDCITSVLLDVSALVAMCCIVASTLKMEKKQKKQVIFYIPAELVRIELFCLLVLKFVSLGYGVFTDPLCKANYQAIESIMCPSSCLFFGR